MGETLTAQQHVRPGEETRTPGSAESERDPAEPHDSDDGTRGDGARSDDGESEDPEAEDITDPSKD